MATAAQFRQDPITGRWVSVARGRAQRPGDFDDWELAKSAAGCPFCEGNEQATPQEVLALRPAGGAANAPGWRVRVVANKYPFLSPSSEADEAQADEAQADDLFARRTADGLQEVIIESPRHATSVTELSNDEMAEVLGVYRDRLGQLRRRQRWPYALIFKNSGAAAGASLAHVHSQLVALPETPLQVAEKFARSARYFAEKGTAIWADVIRRERQAGERLVAETGRLIALCPFASRQPYELLILPTEQAAHFSDLADDALPELAALLRDLVARLERVFDPLAFNWMIHTSPFDSIAAEHYYWHVEIVPRVTKTAGYEWATGCAVNAVPPEDAAGRLRR